MNVGKSGSSHDVRGEDPRPLSPFFSRCLSQESMDDNILIQSTGVRMRHHKVSSPLPAGRMTSPLSLRRRALSDLPAEALISPVIPRRCFSPKQIKKGVSRVMSCPIISAGSNEHVDCLTSSPPVSPQFSLKDLSSSGTQHHMKFIATPISECPAFKSAEQDRLPRIHQTQCCSTLVSTHKTPTESARELFNVSPVMGQSADMINRHNNNNPECDITDKVEYFLHTLSAEEGIDQ